MSKLTAKMQHASTAGSGRLTALLAKATAFLQTGQLMQARTVYEEILRLQPRHFDSLNALALIAAQSGDFAKAIQLFDEAIAVDPGQAAPYCNRGLALQKTRSLNAALADYDQALALKPDYAIAYFNRGNVLRELERFESALTSFGHATAIVPGWAQAWYNRAAVLQRLGRTDAALHDYDRALAIMPGYAEVSFDKGVLLAALDRLAEALASYDNALAAKPAFAAAHSNRAIVLARLGRTDDAIRGFDKALSLLPDFADAHYNKGNVLHERGSLDAALASYTRVIEIDPNCAEAHWNKALVLLALGDYDRGLPEYEWRWKGKYWRNLADSLEHERRTLSSPSWRGELPVAGRVMFLYAEQGFGDTLQFCRYVVKVAQLGASVVLEVQPELRSLLSGLPGVSQLISRGDPLPQFDLHCPLASLPLAFKTTPSTIPSSPAYLRGNPAKVDAWKLKLAGGRPRIGLVWSGRSTHVNDRNRSVPLAQLVKYLPVGFDYVCLQNEIREEDRRVLESSARIARVEGDLIDFSDTAALCECLDLIVTVDTGVAHLSGALGRKTWVMLPAVPDWRWLLDRTDSPWYPTMRLYRQTRIGDWSDVMERLESDLIAELGGHRRPL
jgi:tetratricopeptide (TPR) repeat protein